MDALFARTQKQPHAPLHAPLALEDVDEQPSDHVAVTRSQPVFCGEAIGAAQARALRELLVGTRPISRVWLQTAFELSTCHQLPYGLVQREGGPCGVLAAVQAHLVADLFFCGGLHPQHSLVSAVARVLLRVAPHVTVAHFGSRAVHREPLEALLVTRVSGQEQLETHVRRLLEHRQFTCLALLASALLTRGLEAARADADEPSVTLIARHDYCTQEAVNLLLLGRATSNVFDGHRRVGQLRLRGLRASDQPDVGFLALLEASGAMEVGRALKNPRWPVFVVQAESHFLVLFARSALATRGPLDLFFLDGLALQEHHVVVEPDARPLASTDALAPLERVLLTKWPHARITWFGERPL